jgi:hypothetical protein
MTIKSKSSPILINGKTKEELDAENLGGWNVGVPKMQDVIKSVLEREGSDYVDGDIIDTKRPDIGPWYLANRLSTDKKIKAIIKQLFDYQKTIKEVVEFDYTGPEAFGGGTKQTATFVFSLFKKEVLDIKLI